MYLPRALTCLIPALLAALPAAAQDRRPSHCIAVAQNAPQPAYLWRAAYTDPVEANSVRIRYIDHSMFLIQTPDGTDAVTDYAGWLGDSGFVPEAVTMNNAHSSHWSASPDPRIPHALQGWRQADGPADHHLDLGGMLIRNVTSDTRGGGGVIPDNNSIFVFEAEGLCIVHLGHLHQELSDSQLASIGRADVVMAAVDGGMTAGIPSMIRIVERLHASIVIPMHWFGGASLDRFLAGVSGNWDIRRAGTPELTVSLATLPRRPTVVVLEPARLGSGD